MKKKKAIYVRVWGGLGDIVLSTPVFKALKENYPDSRVIVLCHSKKYIDILGGNPFVDKIVSLSFISSWICRKFERFRLLEVLHLNYAVLRPSYSQNDKAVNVIAGMAGVKLKDPGIQIFLTGQEDEVARNFLANYNNPIIIHTTSIASINQMWPIERWNELVRTTPQHSFIQLGLISETLVENAIDMRGKTSVRESMALIKNADGFIGVVSFFSHVTNAFNTPGVVFFGPSSVAVWGHDNNVNIDKKLPCAPCVDFLQNTVCPYNKLCMELISVNEVRDAIFKQISSNSYKPLPSR